MKAVVFGAGKYGKELKRGLEKYCGVEILAICDNDAAKWDKEIDNIRIISPDSLLKLSFDKVFISLMFGETFTEAVKQLVELGIPEEKLVIMKTDHTYQDAFLALDPVRKNWIKSFADYTRETGLRGSVAECGVFQGETSMFINKYWPDRTLYLCDTFEGFDRNDVVYESTNFSAFEKGTFGFRSFQEEASETLIKYVKARMPYPEKAIICKGYFPESAQGIDDQFCFVNLDMDLYQPQLEGLRFFWDRMEKGGVILLHDYFHPELPGVKAAVADFEKELNMKLPKIPIGDECSIAVIRR
jgi:hypothetical protein